MMKLQIASLVTLLFIAALYFPAKRQKTYSHKCFTATIGVGIINVIFDMITVYTVNNLEHIPAYLNRFCHNVFLVSIIVEVCLFFIYSLSLIFTNMEELKIASRWGGIALICGWIGLCVLPLEYVHHPVSNYSSGAAVITVYLISIVFLLMILFYLFYRWRYIEKKKRYIILLAFFIELAVFLLQAYKPYLLISSGGLTLVNLAFFLTVESPDVLLIEKLRWEKARADEANAAKSRFLSNMSHEIRTPMNAIVGLTEVLLREDLTQKQRGYLENIKSSGTALLGIINDLLDYSKIEAGKFTITEEAYNPQSIIEDLKPVFKERVGDKNILLNYKIDDKLPPRLYGDDLRIRQVLINLTNNAIKYTKKGFVLISLQVTEQDNDEVTLCFSVRDSGIGIKKEDIPYLFDAFSQMDIKKNKGKEGTGLGLAICKQLVELMGGTLEVTSTYRKGSEFSFTLTQKILPLEEPNPEKETASSSPEKLTAFNFTAKKANILVVDDMELNREVALALLEPIGMHMEEAENGQDALDKIKENDYDLILMDHYMPVMDGVEATKAIRALPDEKYQKLPILALTADVVAGEKEAFFEAGMNEVISKPIQIHEMNEKLRKYLDSTLIENR